MQRLNAGHWVRLQGPAERGVIKPRLRTVQGIPVYGNSQSPSLISGIPVELLRHIFSLSTDAKISVGKVAKSMPVATVLSLVCRHWRGVALASPTLWSSLEFAVDACSKKGRNGDRALALTEGLLKKSRREPLIISFKDSPEASYDDDTATFDFRFLETLCLHTERWSTISLSVGLSFVEVPAFRAVDGHLSSLRTVQFAPYDDNGFYNIDVVQELFFSLGPFSALQHIETIDRENSDFPTGPLPMVPWAQLQSLSLNNTSFLPHILPLCRRLTTLTLTVWDHDFILEFTDGWVDKEGYLQGLKDMKAFTMPDLQSLTIENHGSNALSTLFRKVTTPALKAIHFVALFENKELTEDGLIALLDCLDRSSCSITSLSLCEGLMDHAQVIRLLERLPGLTTLSLCELSRTSPYHGTSDLEEGGEEVVKEEYVGGLEGKLCTPGLFDRFITRASFMPPLLPNLRHLYVSLYGKVLPARDFITFVNWWMQKRPSEFGGVPTQNGTSLLRLTFLDRDSIFVSGFEWYELFQMDDRMEVYLRNRDGAPLFPDWNFPSRRCAVEK